MKPDHLGAILRVLSLILWAASGCAPARTSPTGLHDLVAEEGVKKDGALPASAQTPPNWYMRIVPAPVSAERMENGENDLANCKLDKPLTREAAYKILLSTQRFAGTAVGYAGVVSIQAASFRVIFVGPDALPAFRDLLARGQNEGKMYALCGLYLLDRPAFDREVEAFRHRDDQVTTMFGCIVTRIPIHKLIEASGPDRFDIMNGDFPNALKPHPPSTQASQ